ncbi:unnamed protein product [Acanthoscelides obtectus]|uniref:Uncharacterized protein n=1 Tax=Acanthoscelides obtectus TaxID=200917 RepID=A0A9P0JKV3_ACAOB|nr:unnamed protein product [Acanthoscelides obtectus]CAK1665788.1 hypothetical protein AOBTE_LOCUS24966 [Acanthoscelides obtectus]
MFISDYSSSGLFNELEKCTAYTYLTIKSTSFATGVKLHITRVFRICERQNKVRSSKAFSDCLR